MTPTSGRALWRAAVLVLAGALAATLWAVAGYRWVDVPPEPQDAAAPARADVAAIMPTIAAIERIRQASGKYPAYLDDLAGHLPTGVIADSAGDTLTIDTGGGAVWVYQRRPDGQGYELTRHLSNGTSLAANVDRGRITWSDLRDDDEKTEPAMLPSSG